MRRYEDTRAPKIVELPQVPHDLSALPRLDATWLIGFPVVPVTIADDDRTVRMLLAVDEETELIVTGAPLLDGVPAAVEAIYEAFRGRGLVKSRGLPREVLISQRNLYEALRPVLAPLGVACRYERVIPLLDALADQSISRLGDGDPMAMLDVDLDEATPAPDDLEGWKACESKLYERAIGRLTAAGRGADRAAMRYFGDAETAEAFLSDADDFTPNGCFLEWWWTDYRPGKRRKTPAEKMLKEGLSEPQEALLRARMDAPPSLYRVAAIQQSGSVTLLDVLFGGETVLHDKQLAESAPLDIVIPARVFPAGDFHFASLLGPPLPALFVNDAVDFLESLRMKLTPKGTRAKAHLFGRLWGWLEEQRDLKSSPPRLHNTDGEELVFHTATYAVSDEVAARKALAAREDTDTPDDGEHYYWLRDPDKALSGEGTVYLGTLSFNGGRLTLQVNSAERLARAREWLDAAPGIAFLSVKTRAAEDLLKKPTRDKKTEDREKAPIPPDVLEEVEILLVKHYMEWLDIPLPALGDRTPRQACSSEKGREKVARMIRSIPRSRGPGGADVEPPRDAMLEELGLGPP